MSTYNFMRSFHHDHIVIVHCEQRLTPRLDGLHYPSIICTHDNNICIHAWLQFHRNIIAGSWNDHSNFRA